jgi:hypothetical protein
LAQKLKTTDTMTADEAIAIINAALKPARLTDLQEVVFRQSWSGRTYQEVAKETGYDPDYIRGVGFQLWQTLSEMFGEKVTKNNFRSVLRHQTGTRSLKTKTDVDRTGNQEATLPAPVSRPQSPQHLLELPEGPVSLDSPFYIERPPIEALCDDAIAKPGALIRLRAPGLMCKTSLKNRILSTAARLGYRVVRLNFEQVDETKFSNLNQLLRWFCATVTQQLQLPSRLDDYWDQDCGAKVSCTIYFQGYVLEQIDSPLVLALDEVNRLLEYPEVAQSFLPLLRSWYEEARDLEIWQKLRLVVVHSTEIYVPLDINQSPFNVGLAIRLPEFNALQVQDLAQRYGLNWQPAQSDRLMALLGGHPYRVRLALYHLASQGLDLERLLQESATLTGIYSQRLRQHWITLQQHPELMAAMQQIVTSAPGVKIDPIAAYQLESMGLAKFVGEQVVPSCEMYRLFFSSQVSS